MGYSHAYTAFDIQATNSTDEVLDNGQRCNLMGLSTCRCAGPTSHAEVKTDRKHREFFYDGKTFTLFGRRVNYYATVPHPPHCANWPSSWPASRSKRRWPNLFLWGSEGNRASDLRSAIRSGPSTIGATECEQYALRKEGVDWQIWIQKGDTPLPRKLAITTTSDPAQPQYVVVMNWNTTARLDDATFSFSPPEGAMRIVLQTAEGKVAPQAK